MPTIYFKVVCSEEAAMAGAGLGYSEIYGDRPRYFWDHGQASARARQLNSPEYGDAGCGSYAVEARQVYGDGTFDDDDDAYAIAQLGLRTQMPAH